MRTLLAAAMLLAATAVLAACGSSSPTAATPARTATATPAGSSTPLVSNRDPVQSNLASPKPDPVHSGTQAVRARPAQFGTDNDEVSPTGAKPIDPCSLVTAAQARAIVGGPVARRIGRQGPTCIYTPRHSKQLVTVAVQTTPVSAAARTSRASIRLRLAGRAAYCVNQGQLAMFVPLSGGRVLRVAAACPIAARFATAALPRLRG